MKFECPYCGSVQHQSIPTADPAVVLCRLEEGGCDGNFVAEVRVTYTPIVKRIEGEVDRLRRVRATA